MNTRCSTSLIIQGTKTIRKYIHLPDKQKTKSQYQILERMWGNEKSNTRVGVQPLLKTIWLRIEK